LLIDEAIGLMTTTGARVTKVDLADYPLPLYDGDLEADQGLPENAKILKSHMIAHDGFLIAAPEYNGAITAVLKNVIDWVSRPQPDEPSLVAYRGKTAALLAASPGVIGGLRGLTIMRMILTNLGMVVIPEQQTIPRANGAFDASGRLKESADRDAVRIVTDRLVQVTTQLINRKSEP
jgi:NAD(P)H-dependent FMN reductase